MAIVLFAFSYIIAQTLEDAVKFAEEYNFQKAEEIIIRLLKDDFKNTKLNYTYGVILGNLGRWNEAIIYLNRAYQNSNDDVVAYTYALALEKTNNLSEAKKIWKKLTNSKNPDIRKKSQ
ncbi:MAG: hypothetical protein NZ870_04255, partial [bacterium]|nr:hypothetical protein [bacterium]